MRILMDRCMRQKNIGTRPNNAKNARAGDIFIGLLKKSSRQQIDFRHSYEVRLRKQLPCIISCPWNIDKKLCQKVCMQLKFPSSIALLAIWNTVLCRMSLHMCWRYEERSVEVESYNHWGGATSLGGINLCPGWTFWGAWLETYCPYII